MTEAQSPASTELSGAMPEGSTPPASAPPVTGWRQLLDQLHQLAGLVIRETARQGIGTTGAALAFVTVLTLVPLLAAFSAIGLRAFAQYQEQVLDVLLVILPYSEIALRHNIEEFVLQAQGVRGIGVLFFFASSLVAFATVERAIDRVWVAPRRTLKARFLSFTLLLFWGPLLLGAALSSAIRLLRIEPLGPRLASGFGSALPTVLLLVGLTMLYWLVPNMTVRLRCAFAGAATTTALLELLRRGFGLYVALFPDLGLIYGSFSLVLVFMISLDVAWTLVLIGNVLVFTLQHFDALTDIESRRGRPLGPWLGLAAASILARSHRHGRPILPSAVLASRLRVLPGRLAQGLEPLLHGGFLERADGSEDGYLLSYPADHTPVADLLACYDPTSNDLEVRQLPPTLEPLRHALLSHRDEYLAGRTLADLALSSNDETSRPNSLSLPKNLA